MTRPLVVLLHGMWSTPHTLQPLRGWFEQRGFPTLTPRLPGHYPKNSTTEADRAQLTGLGLADYITALEHELRDVQVPVVLVGHSLGGLLAQILASRMICIGLVLLAPATPAGINPWALSVIRTFGRNLLRFPLWRSLTSLSLANVRYGIANCQPADVQARIVREAGFESGRASLEIGAWFLLRQPPSRVNFDKIYCPVFLAVGEQDRITPSSKGLKLAQCFDRCTTHVLPGRCHWLIEGTALEQLTPMLSRWLTQHQLLPVSDDNSDENNSENNGGNNRGGQGYAALE